MFFDAESIQEFAYLVCAFITYQLVMIYGEYFKKKDCDDARD